MFHILQRFATKLCNFTNFRMLFNAVVINFPISTFFKILSTMQSVHYQLLQMIVWEIFHFVLPGFAFASNVTRAESCAVEEGFVHIRCNTDYAFR